MKEIIKIKLVSNSWVGRVKRIGAVKLAKRADAQTVEGKWRRGRLKLRCVIALIVT